ncbi:hypothetical protein OCU04_000770 [Sclerotinia nivalis]|uniref:C2H2-type domain-containing protein n=1 Tax=Sclerotinia nivalis TaxID=352851 RepID=A0A9X0AWT9_9HELO|nr:hypothetical protein OCU04_000770 [Sclerotinia nivalis]
MPSSLAPAHNHEVIADQSTIVPLSHANTAAIPNNQPPTLSPAHPITGRYHCSYPACAQDFKRPGDRLRHISSVHQRGQMNQGKNLCPIVGCRRSYGKGLCRPDKVNDHLRKIHGLVRVAPTGGSVAGGSSANGAGRAPAAASGTVALARNGN